MYQYLGAKVVPLTRELAQEISGLPRWSGERAFKPTRAELLEDRLMQGRFHSPEWAIAYFGEDRYRMNGQHSSYMLANTDRFPNGMTAIVKEFECFSMQDVSDLFGGFDNARSSRTSTELLGAHKHVHECLNGVKLSNINNALSGIATCQNKCKHVREIDPEARAKLMHDYSDFIVWAEKFISVRRLRRSGVVAAMFATWEHDESHATRFWQLVKSESHPNNNNATRTLSTFLRETDNESRRGRTNGTRLWNTRAIYVKSIHAWNAWRRNRATSLRYSEASDLPSLV